MKKQKNMRLKLLSIALFAALIAISCGGDDDSDGRLQSEIDEEIILNYLADNNITAQEDPSGLYFEILNAGGPDKPTLSTSVTVKYRGYYTDGEVFDQTEGDDTFSNQLGGLIQGWQIGLQKIGRGGRMNLFIPSALGYGPFPPGDIRPNAVLVFEVELVNF